MKKAVIAAAMAAIVASPIALAEHTGHLDVKYMGGVSTKANYDGTTTDSDLSLQGISAGFYVPMREYFFWAGKFDYSEDSIDGVITDASVGKLYAGGRYPFSEHFAARAYAGYATSEFNVEGTGSDKGNGAMGGVAADINFSKMAIEVYAEQGKVSDITLLDVGVNGYWSFTPAIAVGLGYKYRDFEAEDLGIKYGLDFGYVEAGLRISF